MTSEDFEFLNRHMQPLPAPDPWDTSIASGGWSNPDNIVPSDFGKLRKIYGEELAEQIEIDDELRHAGDY